MQVNSTRACSTYSAETTPPSHCGVLPSGKKCTEKFSCKKITKQNFPIHSGLECMWSLRHACPQWGGLESLQEQWLCNETLQWQSISVPNWDSGWVGHKKNMISLPID